MAPWIRIEVRAHSIATSDANSLAIPDSVSALTPASIREAAHHVRSRAAEMFVAMSARFSLIAWKSLIGCPNA
jgi:hypothetical protein